jgi:hypothetical protein
MQTPESVFDNSLIMDLVSILVVSIVTLTAIVAGFYAYGVAHLNEIKQNWVQYRCNPIYMPIAGAVGSDVMSNFTHCTMQSVQSYAGFIMDPIFNAFKDLQDMFGYILNSMQFIRQKIAGTSNAFLSIISSVFGKIQNTLGITAQLFGRMRTIINRIIAVFVVMVHVATTGVSTGESINNGPVGTVGRFLCFDPNTVIDGQMLKDIRLNDVLSSGERIESILRFDGSGTPMVIIDGVTVSGNHKIKYNDEWIRCEDHPSAEKTDSLPIIMCLNTSTHTITIGNNVFKDYEETDDVEEFYKDVAEYYNSVVNPLRFKYRQSGFNAAHTKILMSDGTTKDINRINIGEYVAEGGRVIGNVIHKTVFPYFKVSDDLLVAGGTMMFLDDKVDVVAADEYMPTINSVFAMNLLTENALVVAVDAHGKKFTFLDDQEVPSSDIHDRRDKKVIEA